MAFGAWDHLPDLSFFPQIISAKIQNICFNLLLKFL